MGLTYRALPPGEWPKLTAFMDARQQPTPSPDSCVAAVSEDESGAILGVLFMQVQWHMEPLVLDTPLVRYDKLYDVLRLAFADYPGTSFYCYTNAALVGKMAASMGFKRLGDAWQGQFSEER